MRLVTFASASVRPPHGPGVPRDAAIGPRVTMGATVLLGYVVPAVPVWAGIAAAGVLRWAARAAASDPPVNAR